MPISMFIAIGALSLAAWCIVGILLWESMQPPEGDD